jgi:hypothetical protein
MNYIDKTIVLENGRKIHYTKDVSNMSLKEANKMLAAIRKSLYDGDDIGSIEQQVTAQTTRDRDSLKVKNQ